MIYIAMEMIKNNWGHTHTHTHTQEEVTMPWLRAGNHNNLNERVIT